MGGVVQNAVCLPDKPIFLARHWLRGVQAVRGGGKDSGSLGAFWELLGVWDIWAYEGDQLCKDCLFPLFLVLFHFVFF